MVSSHEKWGSCQPLKSVHTDTYSGMLFFFGYQYLRFWDEGILLCIICKQIELRSTKRHLPLLNEKAEVARETLTAMAHFC